MSTMTPPTPPTPPTPMTSPTPATPAAGPASRRRRLLHVVAGALAGAGATALVGGGLALASVPSATGTVTACVKKAGGAVRIIDTATSARCWRGETRIAWTSLTPRGAWTASAGYRGGDIVTHGSSTWLARKASKGLTPVAGASWTLLAARGATGPAGPAGPQGPAGPTGATGAKGATGMTSLLRFPAGSVTTVTSNTTIATAVVPAGSFLLTGVLEVDSQVPSAAWFQCSLNVGNGTNAVVGIAPVAPASISTAQLRVPLEKELTLAAAGRVTLSCTRNTSAGGTVWMKADLRLLSYSSATTLPQ